MQRNACFVKKDRAPEIATILRLGFHMCARAAVTKISASICHNDGAHSGKGWSAEPGEDGGGTDFSDWVEECGLPMPGSLRIVLCLSRFEWTSPPLLAITLHGYHCKRREYARQRTATAEGCFVSARCGCTAARGQRRTFPAHDTSTPYSCLHEVLPPAPRLAWGGKYGWSAVCPVSIYPANFVNFRG